MSRDYLTIFERQQQNAQILILLAGSFSPLHVVQHSVDSTRHLYWNYGDGRCRNSLVRIYPVFNQGVSIIHRRRDSDGTENRSSPVATKKSGLVESKGLASIPNVNRWTYRADKGEVPYGECQPLGKKHMT